MKNKSITPKAFLLAPMFFLFSCAAHLMPGYNEQIVEGLNELSQQSILLCIADSNGLSAKNYLSKEAMYNETIAKTKSLIIQCSSRPMPSNTFVKKLNKKLNADQAQAAVSGNSKKNNEETTSAEIDFNSELPSVTALKGILSTVEKIKEIHSKGDVSPLVLEGLENQLIIYLDQAITFEQYLKR